MESHLNEEQKAIQKAAREFAEGHFDADMASAYEKNNQFPLELWKKACELGFKGIDFPEKYGGQGYDFIEKLIILDEFCEVDSSLGVSLGLADIGSRTILRLGNDDQKKDFLVPMTKGESISAIVTDIPRKNQKNQFSIERKASGFIINGKKEFVVNGQIADSILLLSKGCGEDAEGCASLLCEPA